MEEKIEKMLELMTDIVNDDSIPWKSKATLIKNKVSTSQYWETAFEEFTSWFEEG